MKITKESQLLATVDKIENEIYHYAYMNNQKVSSYLINNIDEYIILICCGSLNVKMIQFPKSLFRNEKLKKHILQNYYKLL